MDVVVYKARGYVDRYLAKVIPGLHRFPAVDGRGDLTVLTTEAGDILVVPSRNVFTPEGLRYAEEWSTKTGRSVFDVYIPEALEVR